jgi:hypothetical protein
MQHQASSSQSVSDLQCASNAHADSKSMTDKPFIAAISQSGIVYEVLVKVGVI